MTAVAAAVTAAVSCLPARCHLYANHPTPVVVSLERMCDVRLENHVSENVHAERDARAEHRNAIGTRDREPLQRCAARAIRRHRVIAFREAKIRLLVACPCESRV